MKPARRWLMIVVLAGFVARLIPAASYAHPWDMYIWLKSGELGLKDLNIYKFSNPVNYPWGFYAYPPGWLYWLIMVSMIGGSIGLKIFLTKLPIILSDIGIALILYRLARELDLDEKQSIAVVALWLFNPITYFVSSFWGMFDSIAVLFQMLAIYLLLKKRYVLAGVMIGAGAAVKVLPALLILPLAVYLWKRGEDLFKNFGVKIVLPAFLVFLFASLPFLSTPIEYLRALFQHTKSVGNFTYWMALSTVINLSNLWFVPLVAFTVIMFVIARRMKPDKHGLIWGLLLTMTSFLATSPKVNMQHVNFLIPLILVSRDLWDTKNVKRNLGLLFISATIWIISSWFILAGYSPAYIGRLYVSESYEIGLPHALMVVAGIFGGTRLIALVMDYLNLQKYDTAYPSKWNLAVYVTVVLLGLAAVLPSPSGVMLPNHPMRIAIPESPDSSFIPRSEESIDQFLKHYNVTHVVLVFSPDFVNTYEGFDPDRDVTRYFRFRIEPNRWSQADIRWLVESLKARGLTALLGVYLKAEGPIYRYGVQGFSVDWLESHRGLIGFRKVLLFNSTLSASDGRNVTYAEYFSDRLEKIIEDFDFDGVYLMAWDDWRISGDRLQHLKPLLESLRSSSSKPIFVEGPELLDRRSIMELLEESDYVVLKTAPLITKLYYAAEDNASLLNYERDLTTLLDEIPEEDRSRLLFSAYTFSFVDGWFNPAIELQLEVNRYTMIGFKEGYAIQYADRYVPYKISIKPISR